RCSSSNHRSHAPRENNAGHLRDLRETRGARNKWSAINRSGVTPLLAFNGRDPDSERCIGQQLGLEQNPRIRRGILPAEEVGDKYYEESGEQTPPTSRHGHLLGTNVCSVVWETAVILFCTLQNIM